ncbi:pentapeptide repeat-containing protein [Clostridium sp.]|uniref:pentapeptide repeat-containing protein n=1 Tax=Clostridium sp. TaxID=1506 RepID=UPI002622AEF0|nr:pentapeptide repeat-containing protein [Clostridium sp.]
MSLYNLKADCEKCFGLCCVALYFSASEGFPVNKDAGKPCVNLQDDFLCKVHKKLKQKGLKGCIAYDCFGAGQKVAQITYDGQDWINTPGSANQMFEVFLIMRQLHEMLWYLTQAYDLQIEKNAKDKIQAAISEVENITNLSAASLLKFDIVLFRPRVNSLLFQTSEIVRKRAGNNKTATLKSKRIFGGGLDFIGADLRKKDLRGANLSGAYLIAADLREVDLSFADLIGADLRDADLRGANLSNSIFLTQAQVNSAKGDGNTKLPKFISKPVNW